MTYDERIVKAMTPMSKVSVEKAKELLSSNSSSFAVLFTKVMRADEADLDKAIEKCYYVVAYSLLYAGQTFDRPTLEDVSNLFFEAHLKPTVTSLSSFKSLERVMYEQLVIKWAPKYDVFVDLMLKVKENA